ncbi:Rrf2 family transcriptional regulator [Nocardiopsis sp. CA-288880]|uniref:Rrf2 family transcriptional regulator n=1 Tax=Nocardiopsis sp. CA-288880 TaxID=3239995 RepID=UPI003D956C3A
MQALAWAGIFYFTPGPGGGFWLIRALGEITLMDVVSAIEGRGEAFCCAKIRRRGLGTAEGEPYDLYQIDRAMHRAELAWRRELGAQPLGELEAFVEREEPEVLVRTRSWFAGP